MFEPKIHMPVAFLTNADMAYEKHLLGETENDIPSMRFLGKNYLLIRIEHAEWIKDTVLGLRKEVAELRTKR